MSASERAAEEQQILIAALHGHPNVGLLSVAGEPPDRYTVAYRVRGLAPAKGEPRMRSAHQVEFFLGPDYPRRAPKIRVLTPVFHPNIDGALTTLGDDWDGANRLVDIVFRVARALAWQEYELERPLNEEAAQWAAAHIHELPLDRAPLEVPQPGAVSSASPRASQAPPEVQAPPALNELKLFDIPSQILMNPVETPIEIPVEEAGEEPLPEGLFELPDIPHMSEISPPADQTPASNTMFVQPPINVSHLVDTVSGEIYPITGNVTTMGRGVRNKIVLNDKGISRVHCRIERAPNGFRIVDISSTNGTFVNEQRVTSITLHRGDMVRLGGLILRFEI